MGMAVKTTNMPGSVTQRYRINGPAASGLATGAEAHAAYLTLAVQAQQSLRNEYAFSDESRLGFGNQVRTGIVFCPFAG